VDQGQNLVEIETDKASLDLPAPVAGTVAKILKHQGEPAEVGEVIARIEEGAKPQKDAAAKAKPAEAEARPAKGQAKEADDRARRRTAEKSPAATSSARRKGEEGPRPRRAAPERHDGPRVMPAARRLLEEHQLAADEVEASGPGGRLLKEDVLRHLEEHEDRVGEEARLEAEEEREAAEEGPNGAVAAEAGDGALRQEETVPMNLLRRKIARRLVEAQRTAALLTTFNEIDMSAVAELRARCREPFQQKYGVKLGLMSFFVKAAIEALKEYPAANAEIRTGANGNEEIVYHNYYDIGFAVGGGRGLVVPVLRNAERMSFAQIEQAIADLASRARENKIQPDELAGGTFTITNGGVYGSLLSTPIVNPPQSAILGLHAIQDRVVALNGQPVVRPMMYVALTYDHRLVDGREAVGFLRRVKEIVEDPPRMLIEV
jgi:2-oxoglutarate dehydrogenase E2 component (dihydrolipoamide succinyltransferase)